jgi:tRNA pseudouridine55 synthase
VARRGKKKGRPISGWLVLDKPVGMGSTEAVSKIKWLFQAEKAGHAGTLDPLASGMLPIALGEATKTVPYVQDGAKIYRFTVAWGKERSTDDLEGPVTKSSDGRPAETDVLALMPKYTGVIMQTPPQFSAIKIAGERAYDLAREGETVDIPAREVEIGRLDLIEHGADHTVFEVECGKGTYVRSLARDMGRDLGCFGHIAELRRVEVEPFTQEDFVTIAELEAARFGVPRFGVQGEDNADAAAATDSIEAADAIEAPIDFGAIDALLIDTAAALDCLPQIAISDDAATKIRLGNPVIIRGRDAPVEAEEVCATARGKLVAIGAIEQGMFKPKRVFAG